MIKRKCNFSAEELRERFSLDHDSGIPLHKQLCTLLSEYIQAMPTGNLLPSERFLASSLGISRITVRKTFESLVQAGILTCHQRIGAVIQAVPAENCSSPPPAEIHEMALSMPYLPVRPQLKLLLFENIPAQVKYWETVATRYNAASRSCKISLEWLPLSVNASNFLNYLQQNSTDLFQFSYIGTANSAAHELPGELQQFCRSRNWFYELSGSKQATANLIPFDRSYFLTYLNPALLRVCAYSDTVANFTRPCFPQLFAQLSSRLPPGNYVAGRCWDYARFEFRPEDPSPMQALERFCNSYASAVKRNNVFLTEQQTPLDSLECFWHGKLLSLTVLTTHYQAMVQYANFEPQTCVLLPPIRITPMALAIHKNSPFPNEAGDFLAFLHEPEQQWLLGSMKQTIPPDRSIWQQVAQEIHQMPSATADRFFTPDWRAEQEIVEHTEHCENFITQQCRSHLKRYLSGEISISEVLSVCDRQWQTYFAAKRSPLCI